MARKKLGVSKAQFTYSVIKAPLYKIVVSVVLKMMVPAHQCPPAHPFWKPPSSLNAAIPRKNKIYTWRRQAKSKENQSSTYCRVIDGIEDPTPEPLLVEEFISLTEHIHLWVLVKQTGCGKLIKDTNHHRRKNGKNDVEARHGPRLIEGLS